MADLAEAPLLVFCPSAPEDATLCQQLHAHLRLLEREGILSFWYDRLIIAGTDWAEAIDAQLTSASIILLPITPYFFVSDYCYGMERRWVHRHLMNSTLCDE